MPKTLHPNLKIVELTFTNGQTVSIYSTYPKHTMRAEIDAHTHPAWQGLGAKKTTGLNKKYDKWDSIDFTSLGSKKKD